MFEKLRPLHNNVLIKKIEEETKTAGGLYIPDSAKQENNLGVIIATGNGAKNATGQIIPLSVKVGDKVFFAKYAGIKANDEFVLLKEDDILGVIEA